MTGLRERKKLATRQHIADVAAELFTRDGFEHVTVDQVATAANVAKKTVFNYFPTKEDLVYDRAEARERNIVALVRDRPAGTSVVAAFRRQAGLLLDHIAGLEPGFHRGSVVELASGSPSLQRRGLEIQERQSTLLAAALEADSGQPEGDPVAYTVARTLLAANRSVFREVHRYIAAGATPKEAADAARPAIDKVFRQLEQGLAGYPGERR
jgi:AcrR family transcriptional regulator